MRGVLLVLYLFFHFSLFANTVVFDKITTEQGLSQNSINCIYQDSYGFMWFGTNDGLNKYDGYEFKVLRPDKTNKTSLSSLPVDAICEDTSNFLWIAYADDYLDLYDLKTELVHRLNVNGNDRPNVDKIYNLNGQIWLMSAAKVYKAERIKSKLFFHQVKLGANFSIKFNSLVYYNNAVWANTNTGTRKIENTKSGEYILSKNNIGLNKMSLEAITYKEGLIISYGVGIYYINSENKPIPLIDKKARHLKLDSQNNLWVNSNNILYKYSLDTSKRCNFKHKLEIVAGSARGNITSNYISQIFEDKYGNIWVGTYDGGINKIPPKKCSFQHYYAKQEYGAIRENNITAIYCDSYGSVWFGLSNCRIDYFQTNRSANFNTGFKTLTDIEGDYAYKIMGFFEFSYQGKSIVFCNHLFIHDKHAFELTDREPVSIRLPEWFYKIRKPISGVVEDEDNLWISTYGEGLFKLNKSTNELKHFNANNGLISNIIRSIKLDSRKNLWIGANKGLQRISSTERNKIYPKFSTFISDSTFSQSLSNNYILPIMESSTHSIWVGTLGGGLNKFLGDSVGFKHINISHGLPNNVIKAIVEDSEGDIWVSTNNGISRIDTNTWDIQNYGVEDGLQSEEFAEFAACKLEDGRLMFGGMNGFNVFSPKDIKPDSAMPDLVFTQLNILNQVVLPNHKIQGRIILDNEINSCKRVKLKHNENSFTVFFAGLQYKSLNKLKYRYKLKGVDRNWIETSSKQRFARYAQVKPGNYVLEVMVANSDGNWNPKSKYLKITIYPPIWKSKVAFLLYHLIAFIALILFWRHRTKQNKMKQQLLMARFEKEKIKELNAVKLKFFTNISHEFRTPLTLINCHLEKLTASWDSSSKIEVDTDLQVANRNCKVLLRLVNQLMDFRKLEQGKMKLTVSENNILILLKDVAMSFKELFKQKMITYSIEIPDGKVPLWFDPSSMEKIIYNILANTFKYTPEKGIVHIRFFEYTDEVEIVIVDSGIGILKDRQEKIFEPFYQSGQIKDSNNAGTGIGLALTKELVELHKGNIKLNSEINKGTQFCVTFKKGKEHFNTNKVIFQDAEEVFEKSESVVAIPQFENKNVIIPRKSPSLKSILIVEDNCELREFLRNSFAGLYNILEANNGKKGYEVCKKHIPDMVVSDIMMPGMNGIDLCTAIKNDIALCHIPVILLTAKNAYESQFSGYNAGAEAYVTKPFSIKVLQSQMQAIFSSHEKIINSLKNGKKVEDKLVMSMPEKEFIEKINDLIAKNMHNSSYSVSQLVEECGFNYTVLSKKLQYFFGETPVVYVRNFRLKKAGELLKSKMYTVAEVTYDVGFEDKDYFRKCFKKYYGINPKDYMNS